MNTGCAGYTTVRIADEEIEALAFLIAQGMSGHSVVFTENPGTPAYKMAELLYDMGYRQDLNLSTVTSVAAVFKRLKAI